MWQKTARYKALGLVALLIVCFGSEALAQISFVQTIGIAQSLSSGTSTTVTVQAPGVAAGHSVILSFAMNPASGAVSCGDSRGNSYVIDRDITNGSGTTGVRSITVSAHNVTGLTSGNTITCTHPSVTARALSANEFSGLAPSAPRDQTSASTGNSTAASSGSTATTTQAEELLIGTIGVEGKSNESFTTGGSYTIMGRVGTNQGSATSNITVNPEYRLVSATGSYSATGTLGTAHNWAASIVTYKARPVKLAITSVNGGANPTAGSGFPVVIQSQSAAGTPANVVSATGVSLSLKTGTGVLGGTLTGTIAAGTNQVTITGVTYTKAESGVVLTASRTSGDNLAAGDSAPFTVNPGTATTLAFSTQPGNTTAGSALSGPPTVVVQDSLGNTVTSSTASITLALGANPGGGTLSGTTTKNASGGIATFSDLSINRPGTGYTLTASSTGLSGATSGGFDISVGAASVLAFSVQPGNTSAGSTIPGPPTVVVQDGVGNTVMSSTASITVAIGSNPGGGVLSGTTTKNASGGIASFSDLSINQAGYGYTLTASSTGLTGATSSGFNIVPPAPDLVITDVSNPPASAVAGTSFNVTDTTANTGTATAGASTTSYRLSLDSAITGSDPLLSGTRSVPSLTAGTNSTGSTTVTIPTSLAAGTYFLGACADHANVVAEANETNNCRASTTTVLVSAAPKITALSPTAGPVGTSVTITGSGFGSTQGTSTVTFNGTAASPTSWSATSITAPVPGGATTGLVVVSVGGVASNGVLFTVGLTGTISGNISKAAGGTPIGGALVEALQSGVVKGSATTGANGNYSMVGVPVGSYDVRASAGNFATQTQSGITVNSGATTTVNFALNTVDDTSGISYFYDELGRLKAVVNPIGEAATYSYDPVGNLLSISRYDSSQVSIVEFTPNSGPVGTTVTIYGTGYSTTPSQNTVTFNGVAATVTSASATKIVTSVPAGATTGTIAVTSPTGSATSTDIFSISSQAPTIIGFTPNVGDVGTPVTISGTNFQTTPSSNTVTFFNNRRSAATSATPTSLSTTVPAGTSTGRISVTTPYGQGFSADYFLIPPSPYTAADVDYTGRMTVDGPSHTATITTANKIAMVVFDGQAGQLVSLGVNSTALTTGSYLGVVNPSGSTLASTGIFSVSTSTNFHMKLLATGIYSIILDPSGTGTGSVTLTLSSEANAGTIVVDGASATATTTRVGQRARMTFSGTNGQFVSLGVNSTALTTGSYLGVDNPSGSTLISTGIGSVSTSTNFDMTLPATGIYSIILDPSGTGTGSVTLTLSSEADAGTIVIDGPSVPVTISRVGQRAHATFNGELNQQVAVRVTNNTIPSVNVALLRQDGTTTLTSTTSGSSSFNLATQTLPATETYTVRINPDGLNTGSLSLDVCSIPVASAPFLPGTDTVWVEDAPPTGATLAGSWIWDTVQKASGSQSHVDPLGNGAHQHYFYNASQSLTVNPGDKLIAYVLIDRCAPPREIMLQWYENGSWEHRAFWGADLIGWGTSGTASRYPMGALPVSGEWVRLEVPASLVGMEGKIATGMAFTLYDGHAWFDRAGSSQ